MTEEVIEKKAAGKISLSPREILFRYIRYIPWMIISVAAMLILAYVKLRYSPVIYNVSGKLLVTNQSPYSSNREKFDDIFQMQGNSIRINDEIEIIKSTSIASRVIKSLGLQLEVYNRGKIRSSIVHLKEVPFDFKIHKMVDSNASFSVLLKLNDDHFTINEQPAKHGYNEVVAMGGVQFSVSRNDKNLRIFGSNEFNVIWHSLENLAIGLSKSISVVQANDYTNVLNLAFQTENVRLGSDIIDQYMYEYQLASLEGKREQAANTLAFIDQQLDTVQLDLGGVEKNLLRYKESNRVIEPGRQADLFFTQLSETEKEITSQGLKIKVIDYLLSYLSDKRNVYQRVSTTLGIEEPSLLEQVSSFNRLQQERESSLKSGFASGNPAIISLETQIERLRNDMVENLRNIRQTYTIALNDLTRKNQEANRQISSMPGKEKQLLEVTRRQNILQELYQYLLQKKLETSIASASTISNIKVVEPALAGSSPISPNRKALYLLAIVIGIAIPGSVAFLMEYFNDKVRSKSEVEQFATAPILGEIGHAEEADTLVVVENSRKFLAEQFRIIRSNLQYILPKTEKPVILVTSSFSGEGKSFISTNLGAVLALSGKRTVILEFDIRKPKILKGLGMNERRGITNYIVSDIDLNSLLYPVPDVENLYVIPCGPVPPNPAEMILEEKVGEMFRQLRQQFDVVIIDTAPVGLVSDAITLGQYADAAVYIVRHNYTLRKQLQLIKELYELKKLPHLSVIINDIQVRVGYGGYYGYGNYGYGSGYSSYSYGYAASSGYYEMEKRASWWRRLMKRFGLASTKKKSRK